MKQISPGIFLIENRLAVLNLAPGYNKFSEQIFKTENKEYIEWSPNRSKLAAAIVCGIKKIPIKKASKILYVGAAHGYTPSKLSSVIGPEGIIYGVEFSERCFKELLEVCEKYTNIVPILSDARLLENYSWIEKVDIVYVDIADPQQTLTAIRNCKEFLKPDGFLLLAVKSRSIDVVEPPKKIVKQEIKKLEDANFEIIDWKMLDPYEKDHGFIIAKFKA